jgi:hypothetical protein
MIQQIWGAVRRRIGIALFVSILVTPLLMAGLRLPGPYSGVVFFDRWGNCILFDAAYLMYISDAVKDELRPYDGQLVQIDAEQVYQPVNPGDGLIRRFVFLGPPVAKAEDNDSLTGIKLKAMLDTADKKEILFTLEVRNDGPSAKTLYPDEFGFAVLTHGSKRDFIFTPSDGTSYAVITRTSFSVARGGEELRDYGHIRTYSWQIEPPFLLPPTLNLAAGETFTTKIKLSLPPGEYQFIAGAGDGVLSGRCVMSNAVSFDIASTAE